MQDGHATRGGMCRRLSARMTMASELVSERPLNRAGGVKASALAEVAHPGESFPACVWLTPWGLSSSQAPRCGTGAVFASPRPKGT